MANIIQDSDAKLKNQCFLKYTVYCNIIITCYLCMLRFLTDHIFLRNLFGAKLITE